MGEVFHAPCDVVLSNADVVQPDLLFVSHKRAHLLLGGANVLGASDLVVEILSTATAGRDQTLKRALYAKHGVQEYWLVDPDAWTVAVLRLHAGAFAAVAIYGEGQTMTSPTLAGFSTDLNEIFGRH